MRDVRKEKELGHVVIWALTAYPIFWSGEERNTKFPLKLYQRQFWYKIIEINLFFYTGRLMAIHKIKPWICKTNPDECIFCQIDFENFSWTMCGLTNTRILKCRCPFSHERVIFTNHNDQIDPTLDHIKAKDYDILLHIAKTMLEKYKFWITDDIGLDPLTMDEFETRVIKGGKKNGPGTAQNTSQ